MKLLAMVALMGLAGCETRKIAGESCADSIIAAARTLQTQPNDPRAPRMRAAIARVKAALAELERADEARVMEGVPDWARPQAQGGK